MQPYFVCIKAFVQVVAKGYWSEVAALRPALTWLVYHQLEAEEYLVGWQLECPHDPDHRHAYSPGCRQPLPECDGDPVVPTRPVLFHDMIQAGFNNTIPACAVRCSERGGELLARGLRRVLDIL